MAEYKAKPAGLAKRIYYLPTPYCQNRFGRGASPLQSNKPTVAIFFVIYTFFFFLNTKGYYFFFGTEDWIRWSGEAQLLLTLIML